MERTTTVEHVVTPLYEAEESTDRDKDDEKLVALIIQKTLLSDGVFGMMARIGARGFMCRPATVEARGALMFRPVIHHPRMKFKIIVWLRWNDTYTVELYRFHTSGAKKFTTELIVQEENVYCDMLKNVVEGIAESHA